MSCACWYYGSYDDLQTKNNVDYIEQLVKKEHLDKRGYYIFFAVGTDDWVKDQCLAQADEMLKRSTFSSDHFVFYQKSGGKHDLQAAQEYVYNALPAFFK